MKSDPIILGVAVFSLLLGLGLYVWRLRADQDDAPERMYPVAWLLLALFPALLIFSFFPQSQFSAEIKGATMTGAVGLWAFAWWYGTRSARGASKIDRLRQELSAQKKQTETLLKQLDAHQRSRRPQPIEETRTYEYAVAGRPDRHVILITGDLRDVTGVDVWVNSENTDMQMSRFHERSVSALIRYEGARRDALTERVVEDCVADELRERLGAHVSVEPGAAIVTGAHELARRNGVIAIVHAAAVHGTAGTGYRQVPNLAVCVRNALARADEVSHDGRPAASVLLPILGAGEGAADLDATVHTMVHAIAGHLCRDPGPVVKSVYLLAYTDAELAVCEKALRACDQLRAVSGRSPAKPGRKR